MRIYRLISVLLPLFLLICLIFCQFANAANGSSTSQEAEEIGTLASGSNGGLWSRVRGYFKNSWISFLKFEEEKYLNHMTTEIEDLQHDQRDILTNPRGVYARSKYASKHKVQDKLDRVRFVLSMHESIRKDLVSHGQHALEDPRPEQLQTLYDSVQAQVQDLYHLRTVAYESLNVRELLAHNAGTTTEVANRAAMEYLYNHFMLSSQHLSSSSSGGAHYPPVDQLLQEYSSWLKRPGSGDKEWAYGPSMVMEFAEFLRRTKAGNQSLNEDEILSAFRWWLEQLLPYTHHPPTQIGDKDTMERVEQAGRFDPVAFMSQYGERQQNN